MAKEKSNLIKLTSNLTSFDYSDVGDYNKNGTPHPIADVEAQYDKLDVDEGQLIKRDIGERYTFSPGDNVSIDGGFVRGGAATKVQRQLEDQKRIAKFLTTPKGALFTIKQAILQNQNSDRETNIYNPLSLNKSLIDTLSTRPQRHINEAKIKDAFSSLGGFFNFLVGNNTLEQGRKNGNSVSNNRNVENLKPDVDRFGGKVKISRVGNSQIGTTIKTKNEIDVSGPETDRKAESYIPFTDRKERGPRLPRKDKETNGTLFVHEFSKQKSYKSAYTENFKSDLRRQDDIKEEKARDYKSNKENPSGASLNLPRYDSSNISSVTLGTNVHPTNITRKSELNTAAFFDIKSKGTRKLQVKYGGELGQTTKLDRVTDLPEDFIKFRIRDVINGKWIIFPAIFTSGITDNSQASYNSINYIGRPDAVHIYQNRTRNVSFGFRVVALNETDIPIIWEKMNALKGLTAPQFKRFFSDSVVDETRPVAPIINLTIGDMFVNTPGYFTSVSVNVGSSATWETKDGRQFPHVCDVTVEFTYIGKEVPTMLGKHYEDESSIAKAKDKEFARLKAIERRKEISRNLLENLESGRTDVQTDVQLDITGLSNQRTLQDRLFADNRTNLTLNTGIQRSTDHTTSYPDVRTFTIPARKG